MINKIHNHNYFVFILVDSADHWTWPLTETIDAYPDITRYLIRLFCSDFCVFKYFINMNANVIQCNHNIWLSNHQDNMDSILTEVRATLITCFSLKRGSNFNEIWFKGSFKFDHINLEWFVFKMFCEVVNLLWQ